MRHIASLVAGLLIAPLAWVLLAAGQTGSVNVIDAWGQANAAHPADLVRPALYLAAAGLLLGLVASLRVSPVGPLLAGVAYAAAYLAMFASPFRVHDVMPGQFTAFGHPVDPQIPLDNGTGLLLGALLIVAVASPGRWRRWPRPEAAGGTEAVPAQREDAEQPLTPVGAAPTSPAPTVFGPTSLAPTSPAPAESVSPGLGLLPSGALTNPTPNPFVPRRMPTIGDKLPRRPVRRPTDDPAIATASAAGPASAPHAAAVAPPEWPPSTSAADPTIDGPTEPVPAGPGANPAPAAVAPAQPAEAANPGAEAESTEPESLLRPRRSPWSAPPGGTAS